MKYLARFLLSIYLCFFGIWTQAQTKTSGNVVYTNLNPAPPGVTYGWSGFVLTESGGGGLSGGDVPAYNPYVGQFMFGWMPATIGYSIALQSALSGTGVSLHGIEYGLQYWNQDYSRGTLSTTVTLKGNGNNTLESYTHNLPQTTQGWTNFDQTKTFTNPYLLSNVGNATMSFTGQDDRFWAGWYGPQFRNPYMRFNYTADECAANPLSSPNCPGYDTAYFNQQCTISALYKPACPGYIVAYHDQQCTINPLYMSDCPGYQAAYAKKNILKTDTSTSTSTVSTTDASTTTTKTDPVGIATTSTTTSATSPTSVTSVTSVISGGASATTSTTSTSSTTQSTTTQTTTTSTSDSKKTDAEVKSASSGSSDSGSAKSRAEARAKEVAKAASEAKTLEAQAATQGLVVGLMGFVPGFDAYSATKIADINGLEMQRKYSRPVVDNRSALRQLSGASDRRHRDMVDRQYDR